MLMNKRALIGGFLSLFIATIIIIILLILSLVFSSTIKNKSHNPISQDKLALDFYQILFNQILEQNTEDKLNNKFIKNNLAIFEISNENFKSIELLDSGGKLYLIQEEKLISLNSIKLDSKKGQGMTIHSIILDGGSGRTISKENFELLNNLKDSEYQKSLNLLNQEKDISSIKLNFYKEILR